MYTIATMKHRRRPAERGTQNTAEVVMELLSEVLGSEVEVDDVEVEGRVIVVVVDGERERGSASVEEGCGVGAI